MSICKLWCNWQRVNHTVSGWLKYSGKMVRNCIDPYGSVSLGMRQLHTVIVFKNLPPSKKRTTITTVICGGLVVSTSCFSIVCRFSLLNYSQLDILTNSELTVTLFSLQTRWSVSERGTDRFLWEPYAWTANHQIGLRINVPNCKRSDRSRNQ